MTTKTDVRRPSETAMEQAAVLDNPEVGRLLAGLPPLVREMMTDAFMAASLDPEAAQIAILERILSGTTVEDILGEQDDVVHGKELIGKTFTLHSFRWMPSSKGGKVPFYMMLTVQLAGAADVILVSTSALNVMGQVFALNRAGLLPAVVTLTAIPGTGQGSEVQRLSFGGRRVETGDGDTF